MIGFGYRDKKKREIMWTKTSLVEEIRTKDKYVFKVILK
jgi:hypothetical protein